MVLCVYCGWTIRNLKQVPLQTYRGNIALTDTNWQLNFDDLPGWDLLRRSATPPRLRNSPHAQKALKTHWKFRFLSTPQGSGLFPPSSNTWTACSLLRQTFEEKRLKNGAYFLGLERKLNITCEEKEGAADCTGRGFFNLKATVVFKPSASWGVNQHLGYR